MRRYRGKHAKPKPKKHGPVVVVTAATVTMAAPAAHAGTHRVRPGQTLSEIANRYGTTVTKLARRNHISNPNHIVAGKMLKVPGGSGGGGRRTHVIRSGETLSEIASRYGTSVAALSRANRISNPNLIVAGQKLRIPRGSGGGGGRSSQRPKTAPSTIAESLHRQAVAHGLDPALVKALAWQESGWAQNVSSSSGAVGVMQVMPSTAKWVNQVLGGHSLDIRVADDNVHLGVMYLRHLLATMPNERKALAAYYAGPGNVGRRLSPGQRAYVRSVRGLKKRFD